MEIRYNLSKIKQYANMLNAKEISDETALRKTGIFYFLSLFNEADIYEIFDTTIFCDIVMRIAALALHDAKVDERTSKNVLEHLAALLLTADSEHQCEKSKSVTKIDVFGYDSES